MQTSNWCKFSVNWERTYALFAEIRKVCLAQRVHVAWSWNCEMAHIVLRNLNQYNYAKRLDCWR